jgi:hypothetical protein
MVVGDSASLHKLTLGSASMGMNKLSARLRAHDWLAAMIELVIVVVGILIALQVSNWNQDRRDHARADSYYRRLHDGLVADRQSMDATLLFWAQVSNYGQEAMAYAETGQRVDDSNWKTVLAWYQASQLMPFELEDTTFLEMRDNGDLALIASEDLRKRLAEYYRLTATGTLRANILRHDPAFRQQIRGLTPWAVQQYIWEHCYRQLGGVRQELIDCPAPIGEDASAALLDTYRHTDGLLPNLRYWVSTLKVSEIVIIDTRKDVDRLAGEIEAARGR